MCGKQFDVKNSLSLHVNSAHLKLKKHECKQCRASFSHKEGLTTHMKTIHLNQQKSKMDALQVKSEAGDESISGGETVVHGTLGYFIGSLRLYAFTDCPFVLGHGISPTESAMCIGGGHD
jgi:hypothetical protein